MAMEPDLPLLMKAKGTVWNNHSLVAASQIKS